MTCGKWLSQLSMISTSLLKVMTRKLHWVETYLRPGLHDSSCCINGSCLFWQGQGSSNAVKNALVLGFETNINEIQWKIVNFGSPKATSYRVIPILLRFYTHPAHLTRRRRSCVRFCGPSSRRLGTKSRERMSRRMLTGSSRMMTKMRKNQRGRAKGKVGAEVEKQRAETTSLGGEARNRQSQDRRKLLQLLQGISRQKETKNNCTWTCWTWSF